MARRCSGKRPNANRRFPALTAELGPAVCPFHLSLPDGVMVAQATLTRLVMVRIHVGQPNCSAIWMTDRDENEVRRSAAEKGRAQRDRDAIGQWPTDPAGTCHSENELCRGRQRFQFTVGNPTVLHGTLSAFIGRSRFYLGGVHFRSRGSARPGIQPQPPTKYS